MLTILRREFEDGKKSVNYLKLIVFSLHLILETYKGVKIEICFILILRQKDCFSILNII